MKTPRMRKTRRVSWMVSGWIEPLALGAGQGGTAALTIGCPDDFHAVRLGFPNVTPDPWRLTRVVGAASEGYGDYVNPIGPRHWVPFTFAMGGADDDRIVTRPDAPTEILVAPATPDPATGEAGEPRWTWTDWTPLASVGADPDTGLRVLMLRALVPSRQTICHAVGQLRTLLGNRALNKGFEIFIGGVKFDLDRVTDPAPAAEETTEVWIDNQLAPGAVLPMVQFLTRNAGIVGMTTGDSHQQGTSTTEEFTGFLYRATTAMGRQGVGEFPVGMVNCAVGGLTSERFFARLGALLPAIRPSYVVLPGWTFNDMSGPVHADAAAVRTFIAHLLAAVELCHSQGCVPICLTPFPRDPENMTPVQLEPWHALRALIINQVGGDVPVLDATAILGEADDDTASSPFQPFREHMSDDTRHPNDAGHQALSAALWTLLARFELDG